MRDIGWQISNSEWRGHGVSRVYCNADNELSLSELSKGPPAGGQSILTLDCMGTDTTGRVSGNAKDRGAYAWVMTLGLRPC
jgi:hypothetical protein